MVSKEDMRAKGIKSPDVFDCFAFNYLEEASYMLADGIARSAEESKKNLLSAASNAFAAVK